MSSKNLQTTTAVGAGALAAFGPVIPVGKVRKYVKIITAATVLDNIIFEDGAANFLVLVQAGNATTVLDSGDRNNPIVVVPPGTAQPRINAAATSFVTVTWYDE